MHLTAVHPTRPHSTAYGVSPAVVRARKADTFSASAKGYGETSPKRASRKGGIWLVPAGAFG